MQNRGAIFYDLNDSVKNGCYTNIVDIGMF